MTCHQSGVMRCRLEQKVIQTSLHLVHLMKTPRPYKCQIVLLGNMMNVSDGIYAYKKVRAVIPIGVPLKVYLFVFFFTAIEIVLNFSLL